MIICLYNTFIAYLLRCERRNPILCSCSRCTEKKPQWSILFLQAGQCQMDFQKKMLPSSVKKKARHKKMSHLLLNFFYTSLFHSNHLTRKARKDNYYIVSPVDTVPPEVITNRGISRCRRTGSGRNLPLCPWEELKKHVINQDETWGIELCSVALFSLCFIVRYLGPRYPIDLIENLNKHTKKVLSGIQTWIRKHVVESIRNCVITSHHVTNGKNTPIIKDVSLCS